MKKLIKTSAAILASLSIAVPGIVSANMADIGTTGPDSTNTVAFENESTTDVENNNDLGLTNSASQSGSSGSADVSDNTTGEDAMSGDVENATELSASVMIDNGSAAGAIGDGMGAGMSDDEATIDNTGPDSTNEVTFNDSSSVTLQNNNSVSVSNSVSQNATSGDATVHHNTTGGGATSGSVRNTSTSEFTLSVTN